MKRARREPSAGGKAGTTTTALKRELEDERRARRALVDASVRLNSLLSLPELLAATMKTASGLMNAETSSILILDETEQGAGVGFTRNDHRLTSFAALEE